MVYALLIKKSFLADWATVPESEWDSGAGNQAWDYPTKQQKGVMASKWAQDTAVQAEPGATHQAEQADGIVCRK
jgi:hypothetical protein